MDKKIQDSSRYMISGALKEIGLAQTFGNMNLHKQDLRALILNLTEIRHAADVALTEALASLVVHGED